MHRIVILGRGGAGKSTAARQLGRRTGLPVVELDTYFWSPDLTPLSATAWTSQQHKLASAKQWIMDGDLGPYDVLEPRLRKADTILIFDFGLLRCAWRALRRSRERADFWWWLATWRCRSRPLLLQAAKTAAPTADLHVIKTPRQWNRLLRHPRLFHARNR